jgi:hypothetical protein
MVLVWQQLWVASWGPVLQEARCTHELVGAADGGGLRPLLLLEQLLPVGARRGRQQDRGQGEGNFKQ